MLLFNRAIIPYFIINIVICLHLIVGQWRVVTARPYDPDEEETSPARIIVPPQNTTVAVGEHALFTCRAQGNPSVSVSFKFNGNTIHLTTPRLKVTRQGNGALLLVHTESSMDGSRIECLADNQVYVARADAYLRVRGSTEALPSGFPRLITAPTSAILETGKNTMLVCEIEAEHQATTGWIKDGQELTIDTVRLKLRASGSLEIVSVMQEDQGSYQCYGRNEKGMVVSAEVAVNVRHNISAVIHYLKSQAVMSPPVFTLATLEKVEVRKGKGVNLTCEAFGFPTPQTWWETTKDRQLTPRKDITSILCLTDVSDTTSYVCRAQNRLGQVHRTITVIVKQLPKPPTNLEVRVLGSRFALLRWHASTSPQIESYTLSISEKDSSGLARRQIPNITPGPRPLEGADPQWVIYNVTDLEPFTNYIAHVLAIGSMGMSPPSDSVEINTRELPPETPPRAVYANVSGPTTVLVNWKPPIKSNGQINMYRVYYCENIKWPMDRWGVETTQGQDQVYLTNLRPNATYFIKVEAENKAGRSPVSEPFPIAVRPGVPPSPTNFRGAPTQNSGILLVWEKPDLGEGVTLEGYLLKYKIVTDGSSEPIEKKLPPEISSYTLNDLRSNEDYILFLAARTKHGQGVMVSTRVRTEANEIPQPTGETIVSLTNSRIQITWSLNTVKDMTLMRGFRISWILTKQLVDNGNSLWQSDIYELNSEQKHQRQWQFIIEGLQPQATYTVNISTVYEGNMFGRAFLFSPQTTKNLAPSPPLNLRYQELVGVFPTQEGSEGQYVKLQLNWEPPVQVYGSLLLYEVRFRARPFPKDYYERNGRRRRSLLLNNYEDKQQRKRNALDFNVTEPLFISTQSSQLGFARTYDIHVVALNEEGFGHPATLTINTPEGRPGVMGQIQATVMSATSTRLSWSKPTMEQRNGNITGYEVHFCVRQLGSGDPTRSLNFGENDDCESSRVIKTNVTNITIEKMTQRRHYHFKVRACTRAGCGEYTASAHVRTGRNTPEPPQNIQIERLNEKQMKISWRLATSDASLILYGFRIAINTKDSGSPDQWLSKDVGPVTMYVWSDLQSNTEYVVRIRTHVILMESMSKVIGDDLSMLDTQQSQWSEPKVTASVQIPTTDDKSVRELRCTGKFQLDSGSFELAILWQPPTNEKRLISFDIKVNGSKNFYDENRQKQQREYHPQMQSISYNQKSLIETTTKQQIEPNTEFDVRVVSVYQLAQPSSLVEKSFATSGERTSCRMPMMKPESVKAPDVFEGFDDKTKQVKLRLYPSSERMGAIQWYYLIVATTSTSSSTSPDSIEIKKSNVNEESHATWIAVWSSAFFVNTEPLGEVFTLGGKSDSTAYPGLFVIENKELAVNVDYQAFVRACTFFDDNQPQQPYGKANDPERCNNSPWSMPFGSNHIVSPIKTPTDPTIAGNKMDLITIGIITVIIGLAVLALTCIVVGCYSRRHRPKLHHEVLCTDSSLKQPLMPPTTSSTTNTNQGGAGGGVGLATVPPPPSSHTLLLGQGSNGIVTATDSSDGLAFHNNGTPQHLQSNGSSNAGIVGIGAGVNGSRRRLNQGKDNLNSGHLSPIQPSATGGFEMCTLNGTNGTTVMHQTPVNGYPSGCGSTGIPIHNLAEHISDLTSNDNLKFSQEYESIDPGQEFTWEHSSYDVNKPKNRYANVIAYDHSRVILQSLEGIPGSDYINANWMDGYRRSSAYIAAQGPLTHTMGDFWRIIWEHNCCGIVMMTRLEERSRIKCDQYWPSKGTETYICGSVSPHTLNMATAAVVRIQVTLLECTDMAYYTLRRFRLRYSGGTSGAQLSREVHHYQFTAWPDHGVPESPLPLLLFMYRVRADMNILRQQAFQQQQQQQSQNITSNTTAASLSPLGPLLVHCSAGVGRTGAYIVIDVQLDRLENHEKTVDIHGTVTALRSQRNYTVQTEEQYIFIHDVILEALTHANTQVPVHLFTQHIAKLAQYDPELGCTRMELEFKKVAAYRLQNGRHTSAHLLVNRLKNRLMHVLPYENSRVCLSPVRGLEGSDYINASHIDGFARRTAYIATQGPMPETTEDFWRMLWEKESSIVVMLTEIREMGKDKCHPYWPSERSARYQYFVVDPMVEYNMPSYVLREFKVTDARDGQSRTLRQFQFTHWPNQLSQQIPGPPPSGVPYLGAAVGGSMSPMNQNNNSLMNCAEALVDFITQVHKTKEQFGQEGPITVHCSAGVGRTGVFLALSIALERLRYEGVVDIYQTVRMLRTQRPNMVQSEAQYQLCYAGVQQYLNSFDQYAS